VAEYLSGKCETLNSNLSSANDSFSSQKKRSIIFLFACLQAGGGTQGVVQARQVLYH
jgi:hypothetical protein